MAKISYWHGVTSGVLATAGYLLWSLGLPPADGFILILLLLVVACGGVVGGGTVLSWRHVVHNSRVLWPTGAALVVLSLPSLTCYQVEKQRTPAFLARSDSVRGVVTGRNVFGQLGIEYPVDSLRKARLIAENKVAHRQFRSGDSIWVYRERVPPYELAVWPPGPDLRITLGRLLWLWGIGGVLIVGYGPLFKRQTTDPDVSDT